MTIGSSELLVLVVDKIPKPYLLKEFWLPAGVWNIEKTLSLQSWGILSQGKSISTGIALTTQILALFLRCVGLLMVEYWLLATKKEALLFGRATAADYNVFNLFNVLEMLPLEERTSHLY